MALERTEQEDLSGARGEEVDHLWDGVQDICVPLGISFLRI